MIDLEVSQYIIEYDELANVCVTLNLVRDMYGVKKWAIRDHGCTLNKNGVWELEPYYLMGDTLTKSVRWDSAEEALTFWRDGKHKSRIR